MLLHAWRQSRRACSAARCSSAPTGVDLPPVQPQHHATTGSGAERSEAPHQYPYSHYHYPYSQYQYPYSQYQYPYSQYQYPYSQYQYPYSHYQYHGTTESGAERSEGAQGLL